MATTTVDTPAGPRVVRTNPASAQNGKLGGRPRSDGKPPGSVPKPATAPLDDEHFWEELDSTPKDVWNQRICYLWRTAPILDLSGGGKPITVDKIGHPFDAAYILNTHGSGGYRFDISEIPKDGSKQRRIRQSYQVLINQQYPPKIAYGTWLDDPRNAEWAWCRPALLEEAGKLAAAQQQQPNSLGDLLDIQLKLKELNGDKPDNSMTAVLVQLLSNQDPTKQLELTKAMMEMADSKRSSGGETAMALVVQILREQLQSVQEDLRAMRSQGPPDPFSGVKPVLELLSNLGVNIGGAAPRSNPGDTLATTLGDIATKVIDKGADLAPLIIQAYQFGKQKDLEIAVHGKKEPPQTNPERPWEFKANAPPAVAPPQQPAPAEVVQSVPQPMTPQGLFLKYKGLIESIFPFLQDHFKRTNGDEFREWFIESKGTDTWSAFKKDATPELLIQLIGMTPQNIKDVFTPPEAVQAFFHDMLDEEGADARDSVDDNIEEGDGQDA
jgi:hypothetical protein